MKEKKMSFCMKTLPISMKCDINVTVPLSTLIISREYSSYNCEGEYKTVVKYNFAINDKKNLVNVI